MASKQDAYRIETLNASMLKDMGYRTKGSGYRIVNLHTGAPVTGKIHHTLLDAEAALRKLVDPPRWRACITCAQEFLSEGAHNRMCETCRAEAYELQTYSVGGWHA